MSCQHTIRKAFTTDSEAIANCLLLAMEEIVYQFIGQRDYGKALAFMRHLVEKEGNQYSWQNCWVVVADERIVAAVNLYDGAQLHQLRKPVLDYLRFTFNRDILPEDETQAGEYYIDSLGVAPEYRCRGIATKLLTALIVEYVDRRNLTLGLLVDDDNVKAKNLYSRLGFRTAGHTLLFGKQLNHLQISSVQMS